MAKVKKETVENIKETVKTDIENNIKEEVEVKPTRQRLRPSKTKNELLYDLDMKAQVPVRKICFGQVGYRCKTVNRFLEWNTDGAENMMTIEEVLNMNNTSPKFFHTPKLIIDDVEVMKALGLTELYNTLFEVEDLNVFYGNQLSYVSNKLSEMPKDLRNEVITRTVNMIASGELKTNNMLGIIRLLKNTYGIDIEI